MSYPSIEKMHDESLRYWLSFLTKEQFDAAYRELSSQHNEIRNAGTVLKASPSMELQEICEEQAEVLGKAYGAIEWIAETVHRAHHDGEFESCRKYTCVHAVKTLAEIKSLRGKP